MGEFRFRTPTDWHLVDEVAATIHIVGLDGIPWPCKVNWSDATLAVSRNREESGRTYIGYETQKFGRLMICTGSLLANHEYDLLIELARGTLNRARNQISNWDEGGLEISAGVHDKVRNATRELGTALMSRNAGQRDDLARRAIELAIEAIFELSISFGNQVSSYRRDHPEVDPFWIASTSPVELELAKYDQQIEPKALCCREPFDRVRFSCQQLDESPTKATPTDLIVGPFLDASPGGMSQTLIECDDFRARRLHVLNSMRKTLGSLPDSVKMLHLVSGVNGLGHRHLNYAQQLQLTIDMLNLADELSVSAESMISFDFPWAERLAGAVGGVHPLQVADSLLRQGARVSSLGLEMNLDYGATGSAFRDPLQWIDLVDVWSQLGLPLVICVRMPSGPGLESADAKRDRNVRLPGDGVTDKQKMLILDTVLPMMAARPMVSGLIWQQWRDDGDQRYPRGGLVTQDGIEKPILKRLRELRQRI